MTLRFTSMRTRSGKPNKSRRSRLTCQLLPMHETEEGARHTRMSVLITGGSGFIGAYTARQLLQSGHKVVTFDSAPSNVIHEVLTPEERAEIHMVTGDVTSLRDLGHAVREHGIRRVIHLASLLHPASGHNPPLAIDVNIRGQAEVLEAARLFELERVVWASTVVIFGPRAAYSQARLPNDAPHRPLNLYGASKSFAEFLTEHYRTEWGVDALGLRLTLVYGPGRVRGATSFVNELLLKPAVGEPAEVPYGDDVVDWQYVEDVADLLITCVKAPRTKTGIFNTRFDVRSIREAGAYVKELLPDARISFLPGEFGIAWELDDSVLQDEIGFTPRITMEEGIRRIINHARRQAGLAAVGLPDKERAP